jgi:ATP-dependent RNA helicase RhlE
VSVYGGIGFASQQKALQAGSEIVVATPGRLLDHHRRGTARFGSVEVLVVDEADRMMDMGFIPDLRRILALLPRERQSMLFAATMSVKLLELAYDEILHTPTHVEIGSPSVPPATLSQSVYMVSSILKTDLLLGLLKQHAMESVVVFVRTRHRANNLAKRLRQESLSVACIHGDRTQSEREKALASFRLGHAQVLVATDIAARGLHVEGVTHVVNYDIPDLPAEYLNRVGRTARAGAAGDAFNLTTREEAPNLAGIERVLGRRLPRVTVAGLTDTESAAKSPVSVVSRPRNQRTCGPLSRGRRR